MKRLFLFLLLTSLFWVACGPRQANITITVEAEINAAVEATVAAIPSSTPRPTYTAEASQTPYPTFTPAATSTPLPTYTPYPTHTPYPTDTPLPTETPTPTPTTTSTARPTTSAANQLPPASNAFTAEAVNNNIALMQAMMTNLAPSIIGSGTNSRSDTSVDCPALLATYNQLLAAIVPSTSSNNPTVRAAFDNYESAVTMFLNLVADWVESCRQAVANQETRNMNDGFGPIGAQWDPIRDVLQQVKTILDTNS